MSPKYPTTEIWCVSGGMVGCRWRHEAGPEGVDGRSDGKPRAGLIEGWKCLHNFFANWEEEKVCFVFFSASPFSTTRKPKKRTLEKINSWHDFEVEVKSQILIFCDTVPLLMLLILLFLLHSLKSRMCYLHMYRSIHINYTRKYNKYYLFLIFGSANARSSSGMWVCPAWWRSRLDSKWEFGDGWKMGGFALKISVWFGFLISSCGVWTSPFGMRLSNVSLEFGIALKQKLSVNFWLGTAAPVLAGGSSQGRFFLGIRRGSLDRIANES